MSKVKLVWITPDAEKVIGYCARVSNPANQDNTDVAGLLKYCIQNKHWSIFEMANACFEIITTRDISHQIVRHRSFSFQQGSQRYSDLIDIAIPEARRQDVVNRQNSIDDLSADTKAWFHATLEAQTNSAKAIYREALGRGIAKECARAVLPECTTTKLYMNGTIRSWLHYCDLRCGNGTQKEHADIAWEIKTILGNELPTISRAMGWLTVETRLSNFVQKIKDSKRNKPDTNTTPPSLAPFNKEDSKPF